MTNALQHNIGVTTRSIEFRREITKQILSSDVNSSNIEQIHIIICAQNAKKHFSTPVLRKKYLCKFIEIKIIIINITALQRESDYALSHAFCVAAAVPCVATVGMLGMALSSGSDDYSGKHSVRFIVIVFLFHSFKFIFTLQFNKQDPLEVFI